MRRCRPGVADKEDPHQKEEELVALEILGQGSNNGSGDGINQGKYGNQIAQAAEGDIYFPGNSPVKWLKHKIANLRVF